MPDRRLLALILASALHGCGHSDDAPSLTDSDPPCLDSCSTWSESDSDTDSDTDADTDTDTDTDTHTGTADTDSTTAETGSAADCPEEVPAPLWLSPDDSNSMSSARRNAAEATRSVQVPVRPWEFLNYYSFDYPPAPEDELALDVQLAQDADLPPGEYRLQIGLSSEARTASSRRPMNLALSLDTSGSMGGVPISLSREICLDLSSQLRAGDVVSVVTWDTSLAELLSGHPVAGPSDPTLDRLCRGLQADGGTDLHAGLVAAYDLVADHSGSGFVSRVVLVTDGGANAGVTDENLIAQKAGAQDQDGVYLVGVGVGDARSYNDDLIDEVTDVGRGASLFVDTPQESDAMLRDRFLEVMDIAAREVEVRLDLPPGFEVVRFSGEELSTDRSEIEPQHLAPNDSMVFFLHVRTACDPASVAGDTPLTVAATWKDDTTFLPREVERTVTFGELLGRPTPQLRRGAAFHAYAVALETRAAEDVSAAVARLAEAEALYPNDPELAEIRAVLARL